MMGVTDSGRGSGRLSSIVRGLGAAFLAVFISLVCYLFFAWRTLAIQLGDPSDPVWLASYGAAVLLIGTFVWWRRGKPLLHVAAAVALCLFLTTMFSGATGYALPKLLLLSMVAVGVGQRCLRGLVLDIELSPIDRALMAVLVGYGVLSLAVFAMGLVGFWRAAPMVGLLFLLGGATARDSFDVLRALPVTEWLCMRRAVGGDPRLRAVLFSCLVVCGAGCYVCCIAPNTHVDAMHYHLGIPDAYVRHGGFVDLRHTYAAHLLRNAEMLYGLGLIIEGQPLPTLITFLFGLVATAWVGRLAALLVDHETGILAAVIFFAIPLVTYVVAEGMIDLFMTAYVLAATWAFFRWRADGSDSWLGLFSLLAGFAVSSKMNAAIFLAPLAPAVAIGLLRSSERWWRRCVLALAPAMFVVIPWLLYTWSRTGNPIFPFLNNIFHSPDWPRQSSTPGVDWADFGFGRSWRDALCLPWDVTFHGDKFGELGWFATGGVFLLGLPFTLLLSPAPRRKTMLLLTILVAVPLLVLFHVVQYARYMLPAVALAAIIGAMNCRCAWDTARGASRIRHFLMATCVGLGMAWLFLTRATHIAELCHWHPGRYPWRLVIGMQSPEDYLDHVSMAEYDCLKFVRERIPAKPVVYLGVGFDSGIYAGDAIGHARRRSQIGTRMTEEADVPRLLSLLEENAVGYLAIDYSRLRTDRYWRDLWGKSAVVNPRFWRDHCEPIFGRNGVTLYRINHAARPRTATEARSLLVNTSLELESDGTLNGWGLASGKITAFARGESPLCAESTALEVTFLDCIWQRVAVLPETLYTLSADSWSSEEKQSAMLQILWVDRSGTQIKNEVFEIDVTGRPQRFELPRTSLAEACQADVYLRAKDGDRVFISNPRFVESVQPRIASAAR